MDQKVHWIFQKRNELDTFDRENEQIRHSKDEKFT